MTHEEQCLLDGYRSLSEKGRARVRECVDIYVAAEINQQQAKRGRRYSIHRYIGASAYTDDGRLLYTNVDFGAHEIENGTRHPSPTIMKLVLK